MRTQLHKKLAGFGFLAAMFMFGAGAVNAQDKGNGIFGGDKAARFGIIVGANASQLNADPSDIQVDDEKYKIGPTVGLFAKVPVSDLFAIQPELVYTNVGSKISYGPGQNAQAGFQLRDEVRFNFGYARLTSVFSLTLGPISLQAGPYAAYLVNVNVKDFNPGDPIAGGNTVAKPDRDNFNTIDYGLTGGAAIDIKGFQLRGRYNYGLREVGGSGVAGFLTDDAKQSGFELSLAVGI